MKSIKLIPRYDGKGDIDSWLCRAELIVQAQQENPAVVIPVCLDGAAFAVYEHMSAADREDFSLIRTALTRAFGMSEYDAFAAFSERQLQAGESTDVYAVAITRLGRLCAITEDTALACKFISGLPVSMRNEVMVKLGRGPTLADATEAAQLLVSSSRHTKEGFVGQVAVPQQANRPRQARGSAARVGDEHSRACFRCGIVGHFVRTCPMRSFLGNDNGKIASPPRDNLPNQQH